MVHKVSVYCHITLPHVQQVQVDVADGLLSKDFEVHTVCDPVSADCSSPAATL